MSLRATGLVIERELREAARRKSVWVMIAALLLGGTAVVVVPTLFDDSSPDTAEVGLAGDDVLGISDALRAVDDPRIEIFELRDRDAASTAVEDGEVDLAIDVTRGDVAPVLLVDDEGDDLVGIVANVVGDRIISAELTDRGIDPTDVAAAFDAAQPRIEPVDRERGGREAAALLITIVLYMLTVVLSSGVANGVATEKTNRVSEVVLAIVPPRSMLFGKVIGLAVVGLVSLLAGALPVVVRLTVAGGLPEQLGTTLLASGAWFVGGLMLYLTLAGALGALVSRQEEVGPMVAPLTLMLVAAYGAAVVAGDSTLGAVLAYIPVTSPMVEPYRIAIGAGSPVEYALSLALLVGATVVVARLATTVYRRAIVRTGRRLSLRDVLTGPVAP